jgi:hypothetical protein
MMVMLILGVLGIALALALGFAIATWWLRPRRAGVQPSRLRQG